MATFHNENGEDVTEAVQVLYDIAHQSMDWGSGFLDTAEMKTVIDFAVRSGMEPPFINSKLPSLWEFLARDYPEHYEIVERTHKVYSGRGHSREFRLETVKIIQNCSKKES